MRIIAGTARSVPLKTPVGMDTRPTTDKIKETLFNMLNFEIPDSVFLDLFAGSGAIGLEALSRGAKQAVFVDNSRKAINCIKENAEKTKLDDKSVIMQSDCMTALRMLEGKYKFDLIFLDPPYGKGLETMVLDYLVNSDLINEESIIIIETSDEPEYDVNDIPGFKTLKVKEYKTNQHIFLERK